MENFQCAHDAIVDLNKLVPNPKNPNNHPQKQIDLLAKIISYQGQRSPIVVSNRSGFITKGHGRRLALIRNGYKNAAVDYQDYESEAQEYADMIADNKIAELAEHDDAKMMLDIKTIPDLNLEMLGIPDLEMIDDKEFVGDPESIPEVVEPKAKLGQIYQLGEHRLMCGDSTDESTVNKLMNGEKADMVFTDPPYGINEETDRAFASRTRKAKGNTFSKIIGDDTIETALKCFSLLDKMSDIICYWGGNYYCHQLPTTPCWLVWDKRVEENQRDMNSDCELAYIKHPQKESVRIFRHLWKGMIKASENGQGRVHPTQKPIALAEWCFKELNKDGKTILDLFGGSGSTLIACEKTNRKCFMMELDPHYVDVIIARWEKFTNKKAELIT